VVRARNRTAYPISYDYITTSNGHGQYQPEFAHTPDGIDLSIAHGNLSSFVHILFPQFD
jgi:hypothetical protein